MPINAISREWRPRVPLVHQSHDSQILLALPHRLVVQAGAVHARQHLAQPRRRQHVLDQPGRLFGYNNPDPTPGSSNYGYDVWITVDE